jgi:hypothetical protein
VLLDYRSLTWSNCTLIADTGAFRQSGVFEKSGKGKLINTLDNAEFEVKFECS